jgi:protein-disulfide isomerase
MTTLKTLFFPLCVLLVSVAASAQDTSMLKAPKGTKVAIIVFEDLECPMCSRAAPQLEKASTTYKIPVLRHDFPLEKHPWSMNAALIARYFDQTSKDLGNQFRDYMFQNQSQINPDNLRRYADTFAAAHKMALPFVIDPQGKLAALIAEDKSLGQRIGLDHTPTIYIVSAKPGIKPVEVQSNLSNLYELIDTSLKQ